MSRLSLDLRLGVSHRAVFTVVENEPSSGEATGLDNVTIIYDGGSTVTPEIENGGNGKKVTVQTSDYAKIIIAVPPPAPEEDTDYIWRYSTNFAGLSMQGKLAMVGAAVRQGNKYHFAGNRGDGSTGLNAYKIWGNNFSQLKASNEEDGGAVAHGTQAGPNWSKLRVHANGTYTFYNGAGADIASVTWVAEFTGASFTPISDPFSAAEFGIGLYFDKHDKGTAEVDIQLWRATQNQAPTNITLSVNTVAEDAAVGTVIGTLTATDPNGSDTHAFSIVADPDGKFQIDGNALEVGAALDYETATSHSVTIRATDNGNPALYFDKQFTISVTDVDEGSFPVVESTTSSTAGAASALSITLPANIQAGEIILIMASGNAVTGEGLTGAAPTGYTEFWNTGVVNGVYEGIGWYKVAAGTEGGTSVTIPSNTSGNRRAAIAYRISGAQTAPEGTSSASSSRNPPLLTPSWGSAKTLWIVAQLGDRVNDYAGTWPPTSPTDTPANYANVVASRATGATHDNAYLITARRELQATSEDPAEWPTDFGLNGEYAVTMAVRPA